MSEVNERIGIYGGTFDPIHLGHLILARDAVEQLGLTRIVFIPAAISPHKLMTAPGAQPEARWAMVQAAIAGEPRFAASNCELKRAGPSYAFDTICVLREGFAAGAEIFYLIGEDNVKELHTWHRIDELRALVQFAVFRRRLLTGAAPEIPFPVIDRVIDISSTDVRIRVASGRSIRYLVADAVTQIIDAQQLYRPEGAVPSAQKN